MVDDHTQRPYRSNDPLIRGQPANPAPSGTDPLAELARLIGQNDPFSEFGRDGTRRVAAPRAPEPAHDWDAQPAGAGYAPQTNAPEPNMGGNDYYDPVPVPAAQPQTFGRQQFGGAPLAREAEIYQVENEVPGYPPPHSAAYDDGRYNQNSAQLGAEEDNFYDDEPPSRRRMGVLVIAGVFALAVIGTAGAFGYRALFGSSSSSLPPPVIKADSAPSKIVPAANLNAQSNKQITDRVNDRGLGEKLVSREEQPVAVSPQSADANAPALGSGIVGSEPKKVRTIAIHPDQPSAADVTPAARPAKPATPATPAPPPRVVSNQPPAAADPEPAPAPRPAVARATPAPANAPLSLSPDAAPAAPRPAAAARTAAVAAPAPIAAAPSSGSSGYAVQVSSQRSEAEAQAAFRSLQTKYPGQLGGKQPVITRADLGDKGIYFRAMVPAASGSEATELCTSLKSAGGSCIIQRN